MQEAELLRLARAGDTAAFERLAAPCEQTVWRVCVRMTGNQQDAEDAMQEAMLKAWRSLGSYREEVQFSTWIYQIAVRCCLDALRRRKSRESASLEELGEAGFAPADPSDSPESAMLRQEKHAMLRAALETLPEDMREPLERFAVAGENYEAIAASLHVPVGTLKSRISRGRAALKKQLDQWNYFDSSSSKGMKGGRKHDL